MGKIRSKIEKAVEFVNDEDNELPIPFLAFLACFCCVPAIILIIVALIMKVLSCPDDIMMVLVAGVITLVLSVLTFPVWWPLIFPGLFIGFIVAALAWIVIKVATKIFTPEE
jgi:hypothetical protein